jgi:hypothetical protein
VSAPTYKKEPEPSHPLSTVGCLDLNKSCCLLVVSIALSGFILKSSFIVVFMKCRIKKNFCMLLKKKDGKKEKDREGRERRKERGRKGGRKGGKKERKKRRWKERRKEGREKK